MRPKTIWLRLEVARATAKEAVAGIGYTQFGRAMQNLNVDVICTNSQAAKDRVEARSLDEVPLRRISPPAKKPMAETTEAARRDASTSIPLPCSKHSSQA
jgi:hypothetical protein